jgi:hypothetical protein
MSALTQASTCRCGKGLFDEGTCVWCGHGRCDTARLRRRARPSDSARVRAFELRPPSGRQDRRPWTTDMVIAAIRRWHRETGRTPRREEWRSAGPWSPSTGRVLGLFGTWKAAIRAAGLTPPAQGRPVASTSKAT